MAPLSIFQQLGGLTILPMHCTHCTSLLYEPLFSCCTLVGLFYRFLCIGTGQCKTQTVGADCGPGVKCRLKEKKIKELICITPRFFSEMCLEKIWTGKWEWNLSLLSSLSLRTHMGV